MKRQRLEAMSIERQGINKWPKKMLNEIMPKKFLNLGKEAQQTFRKELIHII